MTCHFMQTFIKQVKIQSFIYDEFDKKKIVPEKHDYDFILQYNV